MEREITQIDEMQRYALKFGREILADMTRVYPSSQKCREDCRILDEEIRSASKLLDLMGECDPITVQVMGNLVRLNGIMSEKYRRI